MRVDKDISDWKPPEDWKPNTKYLYTVASMAGWTHQGVKDLIAFNFKKQSTKDLSYDEYQRVTEWIDKLPPNTTTTGPDPFTMDLFE